MNLKSKRATFEGGSRNQNVEEYLQSPKHEGLVIGVSTAYLILMIIMVIIEDYNVVKVPKKDFDTTAFSIV